MKEFYTVEPCTTSNAYEIKFVERVKIDLKKAASVLAGIGEVLAETPVVLVFKAKEYNASVYASGRILIKEVAKEEAERYGKQMIGLLERNGALA